GNGKTGIDDPGYNSCKIYVAGEIHPDVRVPFREISLAPTKTMSGEIEGSAGVSPVILQNEPVRVYDTSGPWGDPDFRGTVEEGLPPLRAKWIRGRGDVEDYAGRVVLPIDDGYISEVHAAHAKSKRPTQASPARTAEIREIGAHRVPLQKKSPATIWRSATLVPSQSTIGSRQSALPSLPNLCGPRSRADAPSSRPTSIIRKASR